MTSQAQALGLCDSLTNELERQYGGQLVAGEIAGFVDAALHDLRGSVAAEALPEMASRLAMLRIDRFALAPAGGSALEPGSGPD